MSFSLKVKEKGTTWSKDVYSSCIMYIPCMISRLFRFGNDAGRLSVQKLSVSIVLDKNGPGKRPWPMGYRANKSSAV